MTHTPGPWTNKNFNLVGEITIRSSDGQVIAVVRNRLVYMPDGVDGQGRTLSGWLCTEKEVLECAANARLITASPLLLEALKETLDALINETFGQDDSLWITDVKRRANEAVAAFTGGEG